MSSYVQEVRLIKNLNEAEKKQFSITKDNKEKFLVLVKNNNKLTNYLADFVIVCNGHLSVPLYPEIEGLETFIGQ